MIAQMKIFWEHGNFLAYYGSNVLTNKTLSGETSDAWVMTPAGLLPMTDKDYFAWLRERTEKNFTTPILYSAYVEPIRLACRTDQSVPLGGPGLFYPGWWFEYPGVGVQLLEVSVYSTNGVPMVTYQSADLTKPTANGKKAEAWMLAPDGITPLTRADFFKMLESKAPATAK